MAYPSKNNFSNRIDVKTTSDFMEERLSQGSKVSMINLGCARNVVDSQNILGRLKKKGHRIVDINKSDVAIVNTCAFIEDAKKESLDVILDLVDLKKRGKIKKIIVAGCLAQRYAKDLVKEFPEVDAFVGTLGLDKEKIPDQFALTPKHFAYVKICESCFNRCSFCVIPKIKGKFVSRSIESVVEEIRRLDEQGVKEINLIGQDITAYGADLYREKSLAKLLKEAVKVTRNIQWIRLLYAFPAHMTDELIDTIAGEEKICKYIDMPLQHISDPVLKSMNRNITKQGTLDLLRKIKEKMPLGSIRTTFIVGYPGETDSDFEEMMDFIHEFRFTRAGAFVYSHEEGTDAFGLTGQVPEKTKKKRLDVLMRKQQEISASIQEEYLGRRLNVLIEEPQAGEKNIYLGRTEYDAPEVDGLVYVHSSRELKPGDFVPVRITDTYEYDLAGELDEPSQ